MPVVAYGSFIVGVCEVEMPHLGQVGGMKRSIVWSWDMCRPI